MFVDSHCHLDRLDTGHWGSASAMFDAIREHKVEHMLCVSIDMQAYPAMLALVENEPDISVSVGVHPDHQGSEEVTIEQLLEHAKHPKNVAIGETGLDYFRLEGDLEWQRARFRTHIRAAILAKKPLIIHTREARDDTIRILQEEDAQQVGGVMHCFTETQAMAEAALAMNFYISFSGIVTFKNAADLREVAKATPLDRILIETDSPYLAPVPHRGKPNNPGWVGHVAECIADLHCLSVEEIARITRQNYFNLFTAAQQ